LFAEGQTVQPKGQREYRNYQLPQHLDHMTERSAKG
jgi:hypothetical protein